MLKKRKKKNRTPDIIIVMMQVVSLIANLRLLKHAVESIAVKKTAGERH